jgi:hypothetical protein
MLTNILKRLAKKVPGVHSLVSERDALNCRVSKLAQTLSVWQKGFVPPGHYYSPIPDLEEIKSRHSKIFNDQTTSMGGIDLNERTQLQLLETFSDYYPDMPFPESKSEDFRYHLDNDFYAYSDGIVLYSMLRHLEPKRFIEVGSGYSSAVVLDTRDRFLDKSMDVAFIEPYPDRLRSLLRSEDLEDENLEIVCSFVQDIGLDAFLSLQARDILFIDSTHVSRVGSDVNRLLFEILPAIEVGVYVHIHDIFFPFEYPEEWIYGGRSWNECYLLRAFLQYNSNFEIVYFNTYMQERYRDRIIEKMPLCLTRPGNKLTVPGSIWLRKVR